MRQKKSILVTRQQKAPVFLLAECSNISKTLFEKKTKQQNNRET